MKGVNSFITGGGRNDRSLEEKISKRIEIQMDP